MRILALLALFGSLSPAGADPLPPAVQHFDVAPVEENRAFRRMQAVKRTGLAVFVAAIAQAALATGSVALSAFVASPTACGTRFGPCFDPTLAAVGAGFAIASIVNMAIGTVLLSLGGSETEKMLHPRPPD